MDLFDFWEGLGTVMRKTLQLTGRILLASADFVTTLFELWWTKREKQRPIDTRKTPNGSPLGK